MDRFVRVHLYFFGLGTAALRVDRARRGNVCLEDQAKACSPNDQPVRKFKDSSGINMTENIFYIPDRVIFGYPYTSAIMEWRLRRMVPAAAVTTHAKPHAQQQLARDLEVERAAMGQRCGPQSSGPGLLCAGTYVCKIFFFILRLMRYTDVCLFSLSGVLFPRE